MFDLVGNPEDWFSRVAAHIVSSHDSMFLLLIRKVHSNGPYSGITEKMLTGMLS